MFYRKEVLKTTWKLRLGLLVPLILLIFFTHDVVSERLGQSLVCKEKMAPSDVILVDDFDADYLLFERAAQLQQQGLAPRVLVHALASHDPERPNALEQDIIELMAQMARLYRPEILPVQMIEPISLNAAYQIRDFLATTQPRSVLVVTPGFRSRRSFLVYQTVFAPAGIDVYCVPVFGTKTPQNWTTTWHGIQDVIEQFLKLQYYRFYVLWRTM